MTRSSRGGRARAAALCAASATVALILIPLGAAPAVACSCVGFTDAEALEVADVAFTGRVESVTEASSGVFGSAFGDDPVTATLVVHEVYKGSVPARTDVVTATDGAACGFDFVADREYAVFASFGGDGTVDAGPDELTANLCNGSRELDGSPLDLGAGAPPLSGVGASAVAGGSETSQQEPASGLALWLSGLGVGCLAGWSLTLWARLRRTMRLA